MKIYMIKHYWKDGENATWECHAKIDKNLFQHVKENYHNFKEERPKSLKKGNSFIYFCYEDTTDFVKRPITNITFFISKQKSNFNFCKEVKTQGLELIIPERSNKFLMLSLGVVLLGGALYYNENSPVGLSASEPIVMDYTNFIDNWNKKSGKEYRLSRDSNDEMIKELNELMISSSRDETNETKWDNFKQGDIKKYKEVRKGNYDDFNITFDLKMSEEEIKSKLKKATGERTMAGIVAKVLMMNDIELWKKNREN